MKLDLVEKIANALLYEGYMLYPYRSSAVKNRQRFNFGVLYPREHCARQTGADDWQMHTECLLLGRGGTPIEVKTRFLQMASHGDWQEGIERSIVTPACGIESIEDEPLLRRFVFDGATDAEGRRSESVEGEIELRCSQVDEGLFKIAVTVRNCVELGSPEDIDRDDVLLRSLVSVHSILHSDGGTFVSPIDPPKQFRNAVEGCRNTGAWPVLAGDESERYTMLCSPIILYDYPRIAPESAGDLFDGTEIDEILALRILTLTDAEKLEVRKGDDRARQLLERTELLSPEHFQKLHGTMRGVRSPGGAPNE